MSDNTQQQSMLQAQRSIWLAAVSYLKENPTAKYAVDALVIAEVAKSTMALQHLSTNDSVDYSLYENDIPFTEEHVRIIVTRDGEKWPRFVEIPGQVGKLYINSSLDTRDFSELVASTELDLTTDTASLEAVRVRIQAQIIKASEIALDKVLEQAKSKYKPTIKDAQTKAEVEGISDDDLRDQANAYYKAYVEKRLEEAQEGFYRLALYAPNIVYNHEILFEINAELRTISPMAKLRLAGPRARAVCSGHRRHCLCGCCRLAG